MRSYEHFPKRGTVQRPLKDNIENQKEYYTVYNVSMCIIYIIDKTVSKNKTDLDEIMTTERHTDPSKRKHFQLTKTDER